MKHTAHLRTYKQTHKPSKYCNSAQHVFSINSTCQFPSSLLRVRVCQSCKFKSSAAAGAGEGCPGDLPSGFSTCLFRLRRGDFGSFLSIGGDELIAFTIYSKLSLFNSTSRPASLVLQATFITHGSPPSSEGGKLTGNDLPHRNLSLSTACRSFRFLACRSTSSSSLICFIILSCKQSLQAFCPNMEHQRLNTKMYT